jgi:hypothetical protein
VLTNMSSSARNGEDSASGLIFDGTEKAKFSFHILRSQTHFERYRGRRILFSSFALLNLFSAVPRASDLVLMFWVVRLVLDVTDGVGSSFHVLRFRTHLGQYRGRRVEFSCFALLDSFRRCRGHQVSFLCFALPNSFPTITRTSGPDFMFCTPKLVFDGTTGAWSIFLVFRRF